MVHSRQVIWKLQSMLLSKLPRLRLPPYSLQISLRFSLCSQVCSRSVSSSASLSASLAARLSRSYIRRLSGRRVMSKTLILPLLLLLGVFFAPSGAMAAGIELTPYMSGDDICYTTPSGTNTGWQIIHWETGDSLDTFSYTPGNSSNPAYPFGGGGSGGVTPGNPRCIGPGGWSGLPSGTYLIVEGTSGYPTGTIPWYVHVEWDGGEIVPPIPPPSTDFNEVIDYIYDPVLDNSVGTSTVGARFSIAEPTWLSSYGFDLRGPLGNILYTGSSTPDEPGTYDVDVEYYFGSAGAYEIVAWFISDTGVKTVNPVSVYITVNTEPWVFDPVTGDLVPVSSTTIATSTLTNFKVDCPDDLLVGSLCKLAVGLFIPKASSIQGIQAAFSGVMAKAPFSFFTQSKTILDAFRLGEATTGGALDLTLYGNEITVLSQTTGDAIGIDSGMIDLAKGVMIVGLWLLLAWYLYWRIASIFGV